MTKTYLKLAYVCLFISCIFFLATLSSCSTEELNGKQEELSIKNATITTNDLIGTWELTKMQADSATDLNGDKVHNHNLLEETSCFNTMDITFYNNGTFSTNNATMTFEDGASENDFTCLGNAYDEGTWTVNNDVLELTMIIEGSEYVHSKQLSLENGTFRFNVSKFESDQYVSDPGNTRASQIRILALEYSKIE